MELHDLTDVMEPPRLNQLSMEIRKFQLVMQDITTSTRCRKKASNPTADVCSRTTTTKVNFRFFPVESHAMCYKGDRTNPSSGTLQDKVHYERP
ncbi:uncharacterized protein BO96DRAFT_225338 [Aspergillus niger CBS 101883]|uniref:uncharacterized protein n=1 Tax=Aspergillus lacticoffeatus (strain CBS 101883) TaxID=1450533 RepID=UPI000D7F9391|nr:uncharacterized protein BO96DRAFT_225338 [Aspergillus niger CBS 101883]PYH58747.1 hypothetical protein BO96DRAFT_225338 [Aspergillus niger CBS 101883]